MEEPNQPGPEAGAHPPRRLSPLTPVVRGGIFLLAIVATSWDDLLRGDLGPVGMVLVVVLGVGVVYGFASWLRTRYWIEPEELRVDTGVLNQQSRRIRVDRIQGIDIVQPALARLFGLAELKIDVAGGRREGALAYMPLAEAHQVRETLLVRRDAVRHAAGPRDQTDVLPEPRQPEREIARLDLGVLVASMLLAPETVLAVVLGAVLLAVTVVTGELVLASMVPVVIGFVVVQVRKLSAYYGFTVAQTAAGLQIRRGLLERSSQTISVARVQGVVVTEPLLWRPLGWARLDVSVAGYGDDSSADGRPAATTVMPVASHAVVRELARHLLRGDGDEEPDLGALALSAPPRAARWLDPVARRFMGIGIGAQVIASREGALTRRTHVVRHARVQSLRLSQGPVQRLLGLADLHVDSPPGPVRVRGRHRLAAEARTLLEQEQVLARRARLAADPAPLSVNP